MNRDTETDTGLARRGALSASERSVPPHSGRTTASQCEGGTDDRRPTPPTGSSGEECILEYREIKLLGCLPRGSRTARARREAATARARAHQPAWPRAPATRGTATSAEEEHRWVVSSWELPHQEGEDRWGVSTWELPHQEEEDRWVVRTWELPHQEGEDCWVVRTWELPHQELEDRWVVSAWSCR